MTKLQLLKETRFSVCYLREGSIEDRTILRDVMSVRDLKNELQHVANMFYYLKGQEGKQAKWYLGELYHATDDKVDRMIESVHAIANKFGYEVYSPNGAWFVKPLTKQSKIK